MGEATYTTSVMKVSQNGQISIPAEVRKRWQTDRVIVIDTDDGLIVRPFDPDVVRRLRGKYRHLYATSVDDGRRQARAEEAELDDAREAARDRARRLRP